MGPAERYVRNYTIQRQSGRKAWNEMEQAIVMTLIDWRVSSDMRPSSGPGSDCSDLMDAALARIIGLIKRDLTPEQVLDELSRERTD